MGCETQVAKNVAVLVMQIKMGKWVSAGMSNCLRELKNPEGKVGREVES